jgi:hypothetical protein
MHYDVRIKKIFSIPFPIKTKEVDVFIAGFGPVGCAFVRKMPGSVMYCTNMEKLTVLALDIF